MLIQTEVNQLDSVNPLILIENIEERRKEKENSYNKKEIGEIEMKETGYKTETEIH